MRHHIPKNRIPNHRFLLVLAACSILSVGSALELRAQVLFPPRAGLINTSGAAFNPRTGRGYVVDSAAGTIHIFHERDGSVSSVKVGKNPTSVAIETANNRAYIVNATDGTVSVLDGEADAVITTVKVGDHPYSIAADSVAGKVYVSRTYSHQLMIIDVATNQVIGIEAGSPDLIAVDEKTHTVYLLSYEMGDLVILDGTTYKTMRASVGMHAWAMTLNPVTGTLYIAKPGDGALAVVRRGSINPTFVHIGGIPSAVALNSRTNTVYAVDYYGNRLTVVDGVHDRVAAVIATGQRPESVAVDDQQNRIYTANTLGRSVTVVDGGTNHVIKTVAVASPPYAVVANPTSHQIYVAMLGKSAFATISPSP